MATRNFTRIRSASFFTVASLVLAAGFSNAALANDARAFRGEAAVVKGDLTLLGGVSIGVHVVEAGPLPRSGGSMNADLATIGASALQQVLVHGDVATASTAGAGSATRSAAEVTDLQVGVGALMPNLVRLSADVVKSDAAAVCSGPSEAKISGGSRIANLFVNGINVNVTGEPNQAVVVSDVLTLVINERIASAKGARGAIETNAIHVKLLQPGTLLGNVVNGDVYVAHSEAGITCGHPG